GVRAYWAATPFDVFVFECHSPFTEHKKENGVLAPAGPHPQPFSQKGEGRKPMVGPRAVGPLQASLLLIEGPWAMPTAIEFHAFSVKTKTRLRVIVLSFPQLIRSGFLRLIRSLPLAVLTRRPSINWSERIVFFNGGVINGS